MNKLNSLKKKYPYGRKLTGKVKVNFPFGSFIELDENKDVKVLLELFFFKEKDVQPIVGTSIMVYVLAVGDNDKEIRVTENLSDITK